MGGKSPEGKDFFTIGGPQNSLPIVGVGMDFLWWLLCVSGLLFFGVFGGLALCCVFVGWGIWCGVRVFRGKTGFGSRLEKTAGDRRGPPRGEFVVFASNNV